MRVRGKVLLVIGVCATWLSGCASDDRVSRLERRLDSLAVTLTAVVSRLDSSTVAGNAASGHDTATVSTVGVAAAGDAHAPVVIVEFTDYQCPFCQRHFASTLPAIRKAYIATGKVRYVIRDLPISSLHPFALPAAAAARCVAADSPSKYWAFHDSLFQLQQGLSEKLLTHLAQSLGLKTTWNQCRGSQQTKRAVDADLSAAHQIGLSGTPSFVIGLARPTDSISGIVIRGAYPFATFQAVVDSLIGSTTAAQSSRKGASP